MKKREKKSFVSKNLEKKIDKIGDSVKSFAKKWGFTNGVPNGNRKAKGKIDPNTGRYIYSNGSGTGFPVNYTLDNDIEYEYTSPYTGKKMIDTSRSNYTDYNPVTGKRKDGTVKVLKRKYKGSITDSLRK